MLCRVGRCPFFWAEQVGPRQGGRVGSDIVGVGETTTTTETRKWMRQMRERGIVVDDHPIFLAGVRSDRVS